MNTIGDIRRRRVLKMTAGFAGGRAALSAWPRLIEKALTVEPNHPAGHPSVADIEHVIVFMQENRSLDRYVGVRYLFNNGHTTLRGEAVPLTLT